MSDCVAQPKITESIVAGIDPGRYGAVAVMAATGELLDIWDMPMVSEKKNSFVNGHQLHAQLLSRCGVHLAGIAIEGPWYAEIWPRSTVFKLGRNVGSAIAACQILCGVDRTLIPTPQKWKEAILPGTDKDKADAIAYVQKKYPHSVLVRPRCRVPSDDRAEAVCLAEYARRHFFPSPEVSPSEEE